MNAATMLRQKRSADYTPSAKQRTYGCPAAMKQTHKKKGARANVRPCSAATACF
jgi:hypothetical protein